MHYCIHNYNVAYPILLPHLYKWKEAHIISVLNLKNAQYIGEIAMFKNQSEQSQIMEITTVVINCHIPYFTLKCLEIKT